MFKSQIGLILFRVSRTWDGIYCRDDALAVGRRALRSTLILGWLGIISIFTNFGMIALDLASLKAAKRFPPPVGAPVTRG